MAEEGPRHATITANDHGAVLEITAWFMACTLVLCTATRLVVRCTTKHLPRIDDMFIIFAAIFAIGSTISISSAVEYGLGKRSFLLNDIRFEDIDKAVYASTILYVLTVGLSKVAIISFFARLACTALHKFAVIVLGFVVACWTLAITIGVAFECALPRPWDTRNGKCIPQLPFWLVAGIIDIVTDVVMILIPIHIVSNLQLHVRKKIIVILVFTVRIVLIATSITRLITLKRSIGRDRTFDTIPYQIATQCHSTLSVIVACTPALKPFIEGVRTGMLSASLAKHHPGTTFGQDSYNMQTVSNSHSKNNSAQGSANGKSRRESMMSEQESKGSVNGQRSSWGTTKTYVPSTHTHNDRTSKPALASIYSARSRAASRSRSSRSSSPRPLTTPTLPPPRPPPPPEELRPDLSLFAARVLTAQSQATAWTDNSHEEQQRRKRDSGGGGEENQMGIIMKTRQWDVRFDDRHG